MISIRLHRSPAGDLTGFECRGHSGYGTEGNDIICAAVSALSVACANAIEAVAGVVPDAVEDETGALVSVELPEGAGHDAQVLLRGFVQGLSDIAGSYPDYVQMT